MPFSLKSKFVWLPLTLILFVVVAWACFGWFLPNPGKIDYFGAVNALFAGLAFVGVILAILLQADELSLQRKELELTRNELQGQKAQLELQNRTLLKQSLENTFFNLLKSHADIVAAIDLIDQNKQVIAKGRDCFSHFFQKQLRNDYHQVTREFSDLSELDKIQKTYDRFFDRSQADVGHYFRSLYHIFKFIRWSEISDKKFYANLVVAQLSSYELAVLYYNCLSSYGNEQFKPLVEDYGILENFDQKLVLDQSHLDLYHKSAFGKKMNAANGS